MLEFVRWSAVIVIFVTTILLLLSREWRLSLSAFALQYLAVFALFLVHWPLTMSAVKLITGWMCAAVLGVTLSNRENFIPVRSSPLFKVILALVVAGAALQGAWLINGWMPAAGFPLILASSLLIAQGFLQLGMTTEPFRATLGLLTTLSGFDLLSSPLDNSVLVTALLAAASLGLALVGAYLLNLQFADQEGLA
jgi:hypothetical protein